jgi:large subunit ribosomal protein L24
MFPESEKDTKASEVTAITFEPALKTFETDIMEQMGIKEDRVPAKTYWY